ncbi:OmpA family protein [Flavobacterium sp. SUN046]|uniref:OmpA/MotB family protein n=1 Tax=Flavobacterium sp. SUN046 TaxID=3002440 RepID=UPI002DBBBF1D|nr:OmpA family protein [Flavobacterium sp. SUN046]MEC4050919.1 OmpA family protein [Flavobacterium sp. SUN046]
MANKKDNFWIPYADLMTVLMVVFLFISIAYMGLVQYKKNNQDKIFKEYKATKESLYNDLNKKFRNDFQQWNLELDKDLSIKFTNPQVLFDDGKSEITPKFKLILTSFFPKYLSIILQEKYKNKIAEIRIEGHTNNIPIHETDDPYIDNIKLSQDRSRNVLQFLRSLSYYKNLTALEEQKLQFWITANGLSYGRTLDSNNNLTYLSKRIIDNQKSRRVEFKIVTTSELLVDEVLKQMKE